MATPSTIKDYLGFKLHLPHTFWGPIDGKKSYPDDYKTGSRLVVLKKYLPADDGNVESLVFIAEDEEEYRIDLQSLKTYWSQKRFDQQSRHMFCMFVCLVCCGCDIYNKFVLTNFLEAPSDQTDINTTASKRKGKKQGNKYSNVFLYTTTSLFPVGLVLFHPLADIRHSPSYHIFNRRIW